MRSQHGFEVFSFKVLEFLEKETAKGECPLAGNSVSMDRCFINKYMPRLGEHLHYRTVDVSTIKELTKRWFPDEFVKAPPKRNTHRALDDIRESIQELQYYRSTVFKKIVQGVLGRRSQHVQGRGGVGLDTKQTPRSASKNSRKSKQNASKSACLRFSKTEAIKPELDGGIGSGLHVE
ncbi:hypothetical protein Y032_0007g3303 [Ancylostoma ceylanicum]|uniref:Exonuclease domain-containing protein n=1 Tax=Ancylostoma ceylanicum TaxID=53326 RepID=A0A016VMS4_9BILA|nr:hypothetical protein Y032_0007g3303 [Ancylostoma ceylanicum]